MRKIANAIQALVFTVLLGGLLHMSSILLEQKDSTIALKPFLDHAQEYDVLFLGDSLVCNGIYPMELYHKYGIASYNLGTSNCCIPMSYWRLVNALDYASPEIVFLSAVDAEKEYLVPNNSEWLHVALDGFPLSQNKLRAILELTDIKGVDKSGTPYSTIRTELFFPLLKHHSRWNNLNSDDIHPAYNTQKGAIPLTRVSKPGLALRPENAGEAAPEKGYGYMYLRRIIEECQKRNIPIILYYPPGPLKPERYRGLLTSQRIAQKYDVPFLNFVDMDQVIDEYTDSADTSGHLNCSGTRKVTDFIGQYLNDHYDLPDRREDTAYAHWDTQWDAYIDEKILMIAEDADSLCSRLMMLHDDSFSIVLTIRPGFDYESDYIKPLLQNIPRQHLYENDSKLTENWNPLLGLEDAAEYNEGYMLIVDRDASDEYNFIHEYYGIGEREFETSFGYVFCRIEEDWIDLSITQENSETYYFDNYEDQEQDIRLVLIDRRTGQPTLAMAFSRDSQYASTRK